MSANSYGINNNVMTERNLSHARENDYSLSLLLSVFPHRGYVVLPHLNASVGTTPSHGLRLPRLHPIRVYKEDASVLGVLVF